MTNAQIIEAVRYRWKGISSTDPDDAALKRVVHQGLQSIRSNCPMAFLDARGRLTSLDNETDFVNNWQDGDDVPVPEEFTEPLVLYVLWTLYTRDQNDVRDQSVCETMRRNYFESLGIGVGG